MRLDGGMIHTKACMQWCAYYTWEVLHTTVCQKSRMGHGDWLSYLMDKLREKTVHFQEYVEVQWVYLKDLRRITFNFRPTRAAESYSVYLCLDRPLNEAIWAKRSAPWDPALDNGEEVWDIDQLFQGFDYRHLHEGPINLE